MTEVYLKRRYEGLKENRTFTLYYFYHTLDSLSFKKKIIKASLKLETYPLQNFTS